MSPLGVIVLCAGIGVAVGVVVEAVRDAEAQLREQWPLDPEKEADYDAFGSVVWGAHWENDDWEPCYEEVTGHPNPSNLHTVPVVPSWDPFRERMQRKVEWQ